MGVKKPGSKGRGPGSSGRGPGGRGAFTQSTPGRARGDGGEGVPGVPFRPSA
ncbi:hypothetical protein T261_5921 [Streptomyces lydicus]|nr:hypothetical protein T261_5921 [Streptomyces lydicus]